MLMRLETQVILPAQFFVRVHADKAQPEKRLMAAVLEDAIAIHRRCARYRRGRHRRLFVEVQAWLHARADRGPYAFITVCDVLGLDAGSVRSALTRELALRLPESACTSPVAADPTGQRVVHVVRSRIRR
jgi:hypothetical protein